MNLYVALAAIASALLAGCATAPKGTTETRMEATLYHAQHWAPGVQTDPERARQAFHRDARACGAEMVSSHQRATGKIRLPYPSDFTRLMWRCLWDKGWRWEDDPNIPGRYTNVRHITRPFPESQQRLDTVDIPACVAEGEAAQPGFRVTAYEQCLRDRGWLWDSKL